MKAAGTLEERLRAHVQPTIALKGRTAAFYEIVEASAPAVVEEREAAGEARVECVVPQGARCVLWNLGTGKFQFLREEKNADGALLLWREDGTADGSFEAHVVECKRTVDQGKWAEVLQQMRRARRQQLDWENDDLGMDGFEGRFPHRKVVLDAGGAGTVDLSG